VAARLTEKARELKRGARRAVGQTAD
jgi:hypothetical protein